MFDPPLHSLTPSRLADSARRIVARKWRRLRRIDQRVVPLEPDGAARGDVLFSYIIDPFLLPSGADVDTSHTHFWESREMARCFVELGFRVDAISWTHLAFRPRRAYDLVVDVRQNLERLAPLLPGARKVLHIDSCHWRANNAAQEARHADLERRRGVRLRPVKQVPANRGIETADEATVLGNEFTQETYAFAGKPLHRIPISVPFEYPWDETKDFAAARRRFLWFGSGGLVHKGLDLVLEAFAGLSEFHLTVCGPIRRERDFERHYFSELYRTPNIRTLGWIDVGSAAWLELASGTLGLVYPSCAEGGGGSVLTCMHAGLVPVIGREVSVDLDPSYAVELRRPTVDGIREEVRALAAREPGELRAMARRGYDFARSRHTRTSFGEAYRAYAEGLVDRLGTTAAGRGDG